MAQLTSVRENSMAQLSSIRRKNEAHEEGQQHPIKLYLVIWGWLFVLSTCSYLVDFFGIHGFLRWFLILLFMIVKAGLIVAVFMHMAWERLALMYAILAPPGAVLLFVAIMAFESDYTHVTRVLFFGTADAMAQTAILEPPSDQVKKEAEKHGFDGSKAEVVSEGRNASLSGSASAPKEAGKSAPPDAPATGEAGKTAQARGNATGAAAVQNDYRGRRQSP